MKSTFQHLFASLFVVIFCFSLYGQDHQIQKQDFLQVITQGKMSSQDYIGKSKAEQKRIAYEKGMIPKPEANLRGAALSRAVPSNDDCYNAIEVYCGSTVTGSTMMATGDAFVYDHIFGTVPGVWYKFDGNGQRATFGLSRDQTDYDSRITIFEGSCGNMNFLGTNDDHYPGPQTEATINTEWGKTYYIYVSGSGFPSGYDVGYFQMSVSCGNFCDITDAFATARCNTGGGTYFFIGEIDGVYFPLNGDHKVVIGGQTYRIERTNHDESHTGLENLMELEYFPGNVDINLPRVNKMGYNMDVFFQTDRGCTWTLRNDFDAPDCNCPEGRVELRSQQDVNNFRANYPDCTKIKGDLWIYESTAYDLSPLYNITEIEGDLTIYGNTQLTDLDGLSNIRRVGDALHVVNNSQIRNIDALRGIREVPGRMEVSYNPELLNIHGLGNIETVGEDAEVKDNNKIENLRGLEKLGSVGARHMMIRRNNSLLSLDGLSGLEEINGFFLIFDNPALRSLNGVENLERVLNGPVLIGNHILTNLDGFQGLRSVESISLTNNYQLIDFSGLCPLFNSDNSINLYQTNNGAIFNPEEDCSDPQNCDITGVFDYGTTCTSSDRYTLSVNFTGHDLPQNGLLEKVVVAGQSYYNVPYYSLDPGEYAFYLYNLQSNNRNNVDVFFAAVNGQCTWTAQDLYDEPSCSSSRLGRDGEIDLSVFPNPSQGQFTVIADGIERPEIHVLNQLGQVIYKSKVDRGIEHRISLANAQAGVYFVRVIGENYSETQKLVLNK